MLTVRQAAKRLGVTPGRVRQLIAEGRLEAAETVEGGGRYGYSRRIAPEALDRYARQRQRPGRPVQSERAASASVSGTGRPASSSPAADSPTPPRQPEDVDLPTPTERPPL